jgi:hypothetical protein
MRAVFRAIADNTNPGSLSVRLRRRRFALFAQLVRECPDRQRVRVLDIGGDPWYWQQMITYLPPQVEVVLLNLVRYEETGDPRITSVAGDARHLSQFGARAFEVVHANSLIEHLGSWGEQMRAAAEMRRVGWAYFVQTPNRYFPLEPHFLLPFFQFYPQPLRVFLARSLQPGWYRTRRVEAAIEDARSIRLLSAGDLQRLFPDGQLWRERLWGLTKSFVVYRGFGGEGSL